MTTVSRQALSDALDAVDFPADKAELLAAAGSDAPDEVVHALRSLPPSIPYDNLAEVVASVTVPVEGR